MITRSRLVAVSLAAVLVGGAGCQADREQSASSGGHPGAPTTSHGFTLVASGDVLPHTSIIERANSDAGGTGYDFRPMFAG